MPAIADERPPKSNPRYVRFPEPVDRELNARAKSLGMSKSELIAALVAFALGGYTLTKKGAPH